MTKTFILLLLSICIFNSCIKKNADLSFFYESEIKICGKVCDLQNYDNSIVSLHFTDILSGNNLVRVSEIDTFGFFEITFINLIDQEIFIKYKGRRYPLLVTSNDSLFIEINNESSIYVKGTNGNRNNVLQKYNESYLSIARDYSILLPEIETNYDSLKLYTAKINLRLDSLKQIFLPDLKKDKLLAEWVNGYNKALTMYDFVMYAARNEKNPVSFLNNENLLTFSTINRLDYLCNNDFQTSLYNNYLWGCILREHRSEWNKAIELIKNEYYAQALSILENSIFNNYELIAKDLFLYRAFNAFINPQSEINPRIDSLTTIFSNSINSTLIKKELEQYNNKAKESDRNKVLSINSQDIFKYLIDRHKGKVLYIDIWSIGCSPCIAQMPYSFELKKIFENREFEIIYLCVRSIRNNWEVFSEKLELGNENYFLSDEQYYHLLNNYEISSGVPQFVLINKSGEIITTRAKRPSNKSLIDDINKLLL